MDRIRELRQAKELSQARLAVRAGMDPATLNRIEQGKANPNLKTLEKLADALGVEVADLFAPKVSAPPSQPSLDNALAEAGRPSIFAEAMRGMFADWRRTVGNSQTEKQHAFELVKVAHDAQEQLNSYVADPEVHSRLSSQERENIAELTAILDDVEALYQRIHIDDPRELRAVDAELGGKGAAEAAKEPQSANDG